MGLRFTNSRYSVFFSRHQCLQTSLVLLLNGEVFLSILVVSVGPHCSRIDPAITLIISGSITYSDPLRRHRRYYCC